MNWWEGLLGWLALAIILAIGFGRWMKYQRNMDERTERTDYSAKHGEADRHSDKD